MTTPLWTATAGFNRGAIMARAWADYRRIDAAQEKNRVRGWRPGFKRSMFASTLREAWRAARTVRNWAEAQPLSAEQKLAAAEAQYDRVRFADRGWSFSEVQAARAQVEAARAAVTQVAA